MLGVAGEEPQGHIHPKAGWVLGTSVGPAGFPLALRSFRPCLPPITPVWPLVLLLFLTVCWLVCRRGPGPEAGPLRSERSDSDLSSWVVVTMK